MTFEIQPFSSCLRKKLFRILCITNLLERFAYYTIQTAMVLYLVQALGFHEGTAYVLFASFSALFYLTPLIGGYLADQHIGYYKATVLGGWGLCLGYLLLAWDAHAFLYEAFALLIVGNGFFMPNITSSLRLIYRENTTTATLEQKFSLFYMYTNIGALIPPFFIHEVSVVWGWSWVFAIAGTVACLSTCAYTFGMRKMGIHTMQALKKEPCSASTTWNKIPMWLWISALLTFLFCISILFLYTPTLTQAFFGGTVLLLFTYFMWSKRTLSSREKKNINICLALIACSVIFEILYAQMSLSLMFYTEYYVNRHTVYFEIPTVLFRALNPLYIILFSPLLGTLWMVLARRHHNPSVAVKFALGLFLIGSGFLLLPIIAPQSAERTSMHYAWLFIFYGVFSVGELLVWPIGLAVISKLVPERLLGITMGTWYFATAAANILSGSVAQWTSMPLTTSSTTFSLGYTHVFQLLGGLSIVSAVLLWVARKSFSSVETLRG